MSTLHMGGWRRLRRGLGIGLLALLAVVVAGSWLLVVYFTNGSAVLNSVKSDIQSERAGQVQSINTVLTRFGSLSEHVELMALLATPEYITMATRQAGSLAYDPNTSYIFIINEDTHLDDLPDNPTSVMLRVNQQQAIAPTSL